MSAVVTINFSYPVTSVTFNGKKCTSSPSSVTVSGTASISAITVSGSWSGTVYWDTVSSMSDPYLLANVSNGNASIVNNSLSYTGNNRSIYLSATGSTPSYSTNLIHFRTGTGVSSYTVSYANSTSTGNSVSVTGRNSSTSAYVRSGTNAQVTHISYESGYGTPLQFVEYTDSSFTTVKKYFDQGDLYVYSSGTRYVKLTATQTKLSCRFYANGGTWASGSDPYIETVNSGSYASTSTASTSVSRTNYRLAGWSTSSTATSATYGTDAAVGPLGASINLYAVWEETPYITLDAGEGRFGTDRYAYFHIDYGGYVYFNRYTPTRSGYKLLGWSATQGATSPTYGATEYVGPLYGGRYTYYAVWQKTDATITLNGNGGTWDASSGILTITLNVGDVLDFSKYASITRNGYTHLGWSTSASATSAAWSPNGSVEVGASDATYYAVWMRKGIDLFYWDSESTDAALFAKGKPISNLTATRWNRLQAKIAELAKAEGSSYTYASVTSGDPITAARFNDARTAIMARTGHGSLPDAQSKGDAVKAELFEGNASLKYALNAAITHYNNS
nr:MAG TPA: INTERNALIN B BINDING, LEUCINE RICH REPEAT.2A [Caudoviricetes sp.]